MILVLRSKRVTLTKLPKGAFQKAISIFVKVVSKGSLLIEVEVHVIIHHLPDDPDKFAGTVQRAF